ncbi:MAG TPA: hypothetical protein VK252_08770 [Solirubrobacteraceae bacterium]|nr:hypothetical protein [Solirubrobacteraceae bacterium]
MATSAVFPTAPQRAGMYESFYLRAVSPDRPLGAWIRCTVHKPPGRPALGSVWCTVFDAHAERPFMHKLTSTQLRAPASDWIAVGDANGASERGGPGADAVPGAGEGEGASLGPGQSHGRCGDAHWSLRLRAREPELRHLSPAWLYKAPLPRTKLTSPAPAASFDGRLELAGRAAIELHGWPGMVGHNWGSEHAERWIWLHGIDFAGAQDAWLDLALGRVRLAGRTTPWVASGALCIDGARHRLGGLAAGRPRVDANAQGATVRLTGQGNMTVEVSVQVPARSTARWRYNDPRGGERDVVNCSIAAMQMTVHTRASAPRTLRTAHGGAYELGMRERDHGVPADLRPVAPSGA